MNTASYFIIAFAWVLVSVLIGRYIIGSLLKKKLSYKVGLKAIIVSYMIGLVMLLVIISNL